MARSVIFRSLRAEDKEVFKSFIRSLPRKDNYYLMVDVHDDQAINRWMKRIGRARGAIALRRKYMPARSGSARLNHNEYSLKDAIDNKRVRWQEYRVPTPITALHIPHPNPRSSASVDLNSLVCTKALSSAATILNLFEVKS